MRPLRTALSIPEARQPPKARQMKGRKSSPTRLRSPSTRPIRALHPGPRAPHRPLTHGCYCRGDNCRPSQKAVTDGPIIDASESTPQTNAEYRDLKRLITEAGLLVPRPGYYLLKATAVIATTGAAAFLALVTDNLALIILSAIFMGFAFTQMAFLGHDAGHRQGFRGRRANRIARLLLGSLALGVSPTWWNTKHNQHHATPNHVDSDPDIQFPFIAFSAEQAVARRAWTRPLIRHQAFVFPMLLPLQAVQMRVNSIGYLGKLPPRQALLQGSLMAAHFALYAAFLSLLPGIGSAIAFAVVHQVTFGIYNSSVFATNHKGMEIIDANNRPGFFREQVLTSRNVRGNWFIDMWCGGLNYQIEHHLFPTMPRKNLSRAQPLVERFCFERGISYENTDLGRSYWQALVHLHKVGRTLSRRPVSA